VVNAFLGQTIVSMEPTGRIARETRDLVPILLIFCSGREVFGQIIRLCLWTKWRQKI
jgi:hypothetical protein